MDGMKTQNLDKMTKKLTLLDEKLSQFALCCVLAVAAKIFPSILAVGMEWLVPLCLVSASVPLCVFWARNGRTDPATGRQYERRIQRFTFSDLVLAHFAFAFGLFILLKFIPSFEVTGTIWLLILFVLLAAKPFYVFWM